MANRTYHVHPHTGDKWHYAFPGDNGMEGISPLLGCILQGNDTSALAKVPGKLVQGADMGIWGYGERARRSGRWGACSRQGTVEVSE